MLDEEKVILMTKIASYEQNEGKEAIETTRYFRADYIAAQLIKAVVAATISYVIIVGLFILYDFDGIMSNIYRVDIMTYAKRLILYYLVTVVGYGVICYGICTFRYIKAKKSLKKYAYNLKQLGSFYVKK